MNLRHRTYLGEAKDQVELDVDAVIAIHNIFNEYVKYYGRGKDNISVKDIADKMGVDESIAMKALNKAIKKGFVKVSLIDLAKKQRNNTYWKFKRKTFYLTSSGIKLAKDRS